MGVATMESRTTDQLIDRLSAEASPVTRLRHPMVRAALWLCAATLGASAVVYATADMSTFMARARDPRQMIELAATLATGILAILAAFEMSLPDRSRAWALLPAPALGVWVATAGLGCLASWVRGTPTDMIETGECFTIIVATSLPLGLVLSWMLLRAKPLAPAAVAAMGGLGVAGIAAFLLQFFHPFDVTVIDLAVHAVAVGLVIVVSAVSGQKLATA
jgi:hypothetical protein